MSEQKVAPCMVAEVSSNHHQDLARCLDFSGCLNP